MRLVERGPSTPGPVEESLQGEARTSDALRPDFFVILGIVALSAYSLLVALGRTPFLPYHAIIEFIVASVSLAIFFIAWHTRRLVDDDFLLVLGVAQLVVAFVIVLHLLGYSGMSVLDPRGLTSRMGSKFWLIARAVQAAGLIGASFFIGRRLTHPAAPVAVFAVPAAVAVYAVFSGHFPATNLPGTGLTPFKILVEVLIVSGFIAALVLVGARGHRLLPTAVRDLRTAIVLMIVAELLFMVYRSPFDIVSIVGHIVHLGSVYFLYHALIAQSLEDPYSMLFRRLASSEQQVRMVLANVGEGVLMVDLSDGHILVANQQAAELTGFSVEELLAMEPSEMVERVHPDDRAQLRREDAIAQGAESLGCIEYRWRGKSGRYRWIREHASLVRDEHQRPVALVSTFQDVSEEKKAEARNQLVAQVSEDFATYGPPDDLLFAVGSRLVRFLDADAAFLVDVNEARDTVTLQRVSPSAYAPQVQEIRLSDSVTSAFRVSANAGEAIVIDDVNEDARAVPEGMLARGVRALVSVPLREGGKWRFSFAVADIRPRHWDADEVATIVEIANRVYFRVQRARVEVQLHESEARQTFLLELTDTIVGLDSIEVQVRSAQLLGTFLGVDHAFYSEFEDGRFLVHDDHLSSERRGVAGEYSEQEFGALFDKLRAGRTVVVQDAATSPELDPAERDAVLEMGIRSFVSAPIFDGGQLVAVFTIADSQARYWRAFEVVIVEETAERVQSSVLRARAEAQLRDSLERTRLLQELAAVSASTLDAGEMSRSALKIAQASLGADMGAVYLLEDEGGPAYIVAHHGFELAKLGTRELELDESTLGGRAMLTRRIQAAGDEAPPDGTARRAEAVNASERRFVAVPIIVRGSVIGLLALNFLGLRPFENRELELYEAMADQLGVGLENARLYEVEHGIAETLQETLVVLPTHVPAIRFSRGYESATYQHGRVGGDFVDVFEVRPGIVGIALGDVSGKGIDAAVTTSLVRNTLRVHAIDGLPPAHVATKTNQLVRRFSEVSSFVTLWFGLLNTKNGQLRYISAGHLPALVVAPDGGVSMLEAGDPILGVLDDAKYFERQTVLVAGERLVLYSDGITEARSPQGTFLGEAGLLDLIRRHHHAPATSLSDIIMGEVIAFSEGILRDDAAILVVEPSRLPDYPGDDRQLQAFTLD